MRSPSSTVSFMITFLRLFFDYIFLGHYLKQYLFHLHRAIEKRGNTKLLKFMKINTNSRLKKVPLVGYKLNMQGMISRNVSFSKKSFDNFAYSVVKK